MIRTVLAAAATLALAACGLPYTPPALSPVERPAAAATGFPLAVPFASVARTAPVAAPMTVANAPVTILVSIDGFRSDYLNRGITPNLSRLAAAGVTAPMRPSFPSKTFPNHWTIVTGVVPDRHGIVANSFEDPSRPGETFTMASDDPFWWNAAEPIWVTAQKAGIRTATMFWPGSNVAWGGVKETAWPHDVSGGTRPSDWQQFNQAVSGPQRVAAVIDWLRRPATTRPRFVTLYFDTVDTAGHEFGPDAVETNAAITDVDRSIGLLTAGLAETGQRANLVIVADHGMAATSSTRVIALDRIADPADMRVTETGPFASIYPVPGREMALEQRLLGRHPHLDCWRKGAIPARYDYGRNPRVAPYLCLADVGWSVLKTAPDKPSTGGAHGYDQRVPEMRALFIASGPALMAGKRLPAFDNVDVAPLLRDLLGLPPGQALDGDDRAFRRVLRH